MSRLPGEARRAALDAALAVLACPVCLGRLARDGSSLVCVNGHRHDVARQGYASLAPGSTARGDSAAMVAARRAFLAGGWFAPIERAVVRAVPDREGWVADAAGGPGTYLARVLDARPALRGIGLDASPAAARAAAGAHPRAAAATADVWRRLPLADASVVAVLDVFGPRNGPEFARVLAPGGAVVVVTPLPHHLAELRARFGTLGVDAGKPERTAERLRPLVRIAEQRVEERRLLDPASAADAVLMGPSGHHLAEAEVRGTAAALGPIEVTVACAVTTWRAPSPPPSP